MEPSSRTPDGVPRRCDLCGHLIKIEPSDGTGDAPCPRCGYLLWFGSHGLPNRDIREVAETKRRIRRMVREIAELARSGIAWADFADEFLPRLVSCLAAPGGAIWTVDSQGRLELQTQVNLQQVGLDEDEESQITHERLLHRVASTGEPRLVQPHLHLDGERAANPTAFLLVLGRLETKRTVVGVAEIFQRPDTGPAVQQGYARFLQHMCEIAS